MKNYAVKMLLVGCLMVTSVVGCGAEVPVLFAVGANVAGTVGAFAGAAYMIKNIENIDIDTQKKRIELERLRASRRNECCNETDH